MNANTCSRHCGMPGRSEATRVSRPRMNVVPAMGISSDFTWHAASYGFMDDPDIDDVLAACQVKSLEIPIAGTTFFLGRETLVASDRPGLRHWRAVPFGCMLPN